jgi:hypothetical protein
MFRPRPKRRPRVVSSYLTWWLDKTEAELREIEKAKRLRKLRITEASLVDKGACPGAVIAFFKRDEGSTMDKDEVWELMQKRQEALGDPWPSDDPEWAGLYALYKSAPVAAPEPVAKSAVPGDRVWATITKLAERLRDEQPGAMTEAAAIEAVLHDRPDLYMMYCRKQAGLE